MPSETFQSVKLPESLLTKLGATSADAGDKIAALLADVESGKVKLQEADTKLAAAKADNGAFATRLADLEGKVAAIVALDEKAILTKCEAAAEAKASATATAILAKTGGAPLPSATVPGNDPANNGDASKAADPKARWAADKKLQAEFLTAESYDAFCRLEAQGRVRISSK